MKRSKVDPDAAAKKLVTEYVERYMANRGLVPTFPRLAVGFERSLLGHPVYNSDGGSAVAYFSSYEAGSRYVSLCYREVLANKS